LANAIVHHLVSLNITSIHTNSAAATTTSATTTTTTTAPFISFIFTFIHFIHFYIHFYCRLRDMAGVNYAREKLIDECARDPTGMLLFDYLIAILSLY
jgi:hypothetical protein